MTFARPPDLERPAPPPDATAVAAPAAQMREGAAVTDAGASFTRQPPPDPFAFLKRIDWEQVLGRNWLAIIGAVTLVLGIGFFLKLSLDNNWINDTGRILLGFAAGAGLLVTGEFARQRVPRWSQAVTSGGAATLYLTIYAAFALYELIRPDVAFVLLAAVVALAGIPRAALQRHGHRHPGHRRGIYRSGPDGAGLVGRPAGAPVHPGGRPWHPMDFHTTQVAILPSAGLDRLVRCFHPGSSPILRPAWPADARRAYGHLPDLRRRHHLVPYPLAGNAETVRPGPRRGQCDGVLPAHRCHSGRLQRVVRPHCVQPGRLLRADGVCRRRSGRAHRRTWPSSRFRLPSSS